MTCLLSARIALSPGETPVPSHRSLRWIHSISGIISPSSALDAPRRTSLHLPLLDDADGTVAPSMRIPLFRSLVAGPGPSRRPPSPTALTAEVPKADERPDPRLAQ